MILLWIGVIALVISYEWRNWLAASITSAIGFAPMISNITGDPMGSLLGCYVHGPIEPCVIGPI